MSCENLLIPKSITTNCVTSLFGIPYGMSGRTVGGVTYPISGIVLHCYAGTAAELCAELKCRTKQSVISGSSENSFHYTIGAATSPLYQHVNDGDISWSFGSYKNNTYVTTPPPNVAINWPTLQGLYGVNVTPDVYTLDIALAIGHIVDATQSGCYTCPTSSGLQENQHDILVQLLAYLAEEYSISIDAEHINFHDNIRCDEAQECACTDIETLLAEVATYCPPCPDNTEAQSLPEAQPDDTIMYIHGVTEACCSSSPGCLVNIPWDGCFFGELAVDGTLDDYLLGLTQDPVTGQWCLTRGCLGLVSPLIGCGTVSDPLRLDRCLIDDWIDSYAPLSAVQRVMGIDDNGCLTLQENDSWQDMVLCNQPENSESIPEWVLAKTDNTCPEWVTPAQVVEAGLDVQDTNCIDLDLTDGVLTANPIISPLPANTVVCQPDGLFVPDITVVDTNCMDITFIGGELSVNPIIAPTQAGVPNVLSCLVDGLYVPQVSPVGTDCIEVTNNADGTYSIAPIIAPAQGGIDNNLSCIAGQGLYAPEFQFSVANTDCINLSFVGDTLTATPAISIDIGGIQNILSCLPSGLYVPRGANAAVNSPLTGSGSDIDPLDIDFSLLDAQDLCDLGGVIPSGTLVEFIGVDGADCLRKGSISVTDTDCIDLNFVAGVISANPVISPTIGGVVNYLSCESTGLYVPQGAGLAVTDTNCIDLTITNGVLSADLVVNPAGDNQVSCGVGGLYVALGAGITVSDTDCVNHTLVGGVLSTVLSFAGPQAGVPNVLSCIAGQGLFVPEAGGLQVVDTTCIDLDLTGAVLRADVIIDPTGDNQVQCLPAGLYVPPTAGLIALDTDCITLNLAGDTLTATPIIAPAQGGVPNGITCLPGQGLYVANNIAGLEVFFISDDQANTQTIVGADTIVFEGINGATQRVTGVDTVTVDGHMLCATGAPTTMPLYDLDQAWTYYDRNSGLTYNWNCALNQWETPAHEANGTAPPTAATCSTNTTINGVTEGVWTPGISTYKVPASVGQAAIDRMWILTELCTWAKVEGFGISRLDAPTVTAGIAETIPTIIPFTSSLENDLGNNAPPSIIVEEAGCYTLSGDVVIEYNGVNFEASLLRLIPFVDGIGIENIGDVGGYSLNRPPGNPIIISTTGATTICLDAGQTVQLAVSFSTNFGGQTYTILQGSMKLALVADSS